MRALVEHPEPIGNRLHSKFQTFSCFQRKGGKVKGDNSLTWGGRFGILIRRLITGRLLGPWTN